MTNQGFRVQIRTYPRVGGLTWRWWIFDRSGGTHLDTGVFSRRKPRPSRTSREGRDPPVQVVPGAVGHDIPEDHFSALGKGFRVDCPKPTANLILCPCSADDSACYFFMRLRGGRAFSVAGLRGWPSAWPWRASHVERLGPWPARLARGNDAHTPDILLVHASVCDASATARK